MVSRGLSMNKYAAIDEVRMRSKSKYIRMVVVSLTNLERSQISSSSKHAVSDVKRQSTFS